MYISAALSLSDALHGAKHLSSQAARRAVTPRGKRRAALVCRPLNLPPARDEPKSRCQLVTARLARPVAYLQGDAGPGTPHVQPGGRVEGAPPLLEGAGGSL